MDLCTTMLVTFFAGMGAGLGTGFIFWALTHIWQSASRFLPMY